MKTLSDLQISRFWKRVKIRTKTECWPWTGAANEKGYGRVRYNGKLYSPHRLAYQLSKGSIPNYPNQHHGAVVMHECDNPRCCNPHHLKVGTQRDNVRDMHKKKRFNKCRWKTPKEIEDKILSCDLPSRQTANLYGVSKNTVLRIRRQAS